MCIRDSLASLHLLLPLRTHAVRCAFGPLHSACGLLHSACGLLRASDPVQSACGWVQPQLGVQRSSAIDARGQRACLNVALNSTAQTSSTVDAVRKQRTWSGHNSGVSVDNKL